MKHRLCASIFLLFSYFILTSTTYGTETPRVVTSILPVHALASAVMKDIGSPSVLLKDSASPHHYVLSPHDARKLSQADIVFYVSDDLENFLQKPLQSLSHNALIVPLIDTPSLTLLPSRKDIIWDNASSRQDDEHKDSHGDNHHHHDHGAIDPHIWLDPDNAIVLLNHIASTLAKEDPPNANIYTENAKKMALSITKKDKTLLTMLAPYQNTAYLVLHDGYHYFEAHYGLHPTGALARSPESPPGAKTLNTLTQRIKAQNIRCLFSEPQFSTKITHTLSQTLGIHTTLLNPLGVYNKTYIDLLEGMANSMVSCLNNNKIKE